MRRPLRLLAAAAIALSMGAGGCGKGPSPPAPPPPAKKEAAEPVKKAAPKPRAKLFTGTIEELDAAAGTMTLKGPKGEMTFRTPDKVKDQLEGLELGDKVIVKHIDNVAHSIVKPRTSKYASPWKENEVL